MIFIELKNDRDKIKFLELHMEKKVFEVVLWLYPESLLTDVFLSKIRTCNFFASQPVTTYDEGVEQKCSDRFLLNRDFVSYFEHEKNIFKTNVDSICLYEVGCASWLVSLIGHEGMALVRSDENINSLLENGFKASLTSPDWW